MKNVFVDFLPEVRNFLMSEPGGIFSEQSFEALFADENMYSNITLLAIYVHVQHSKNESLYRNTRFNKHVLRFLEVKASDADLINSLDLDALSEWVREQPNGQGLLESDRFKTFSEIFDNHRTSKQKRAQLVECYFNEGKCDSQVLSYLYERCENTILFERGGDYVRAVDSNRFRLLLQTHLGIPVDAPNGWAKYLLGIER